MAIHKRDTKRHFYRQGTYYGGIATGLALAICLPLITLFIIGHLHTTKGHPRGTAPTTQNGAINGTATITLDDALMTSGMAAGLQQASARFPAPFTSIPFTNVTVTTKAGHDVEVSADAEIVGLPVNVVQISFGPQIDSTGHLDFKVLSIYGLNIGPVDQIIEDQINAQFTNIGQGQLVKGFSYKLTEVHTVVGGMVITSQISGTL